MAPHTTAQASMALEGLRQFLVQPRSAQALDLLMLSQIGGIANAHIMDRDASMPVIVFELQDKDGKVHCCRCNPAGFALLLLINVCGQSVFIDHTGARPYVKVFGRKDKSAGTVFARLLAGAEEEENCTYANGNSLDLTAANIVFGSNNRRTANNTPANYGEILLAVLDAPDALFPGRPEDKVGSAQQLLQAAFERAAEDREAAQPA